MKKAELCRKFKKTLLEWWRSNKVATYPWRTDRDPYRTLIAEILLVRTRRDVVLRVYEDFLKRFPDPCTLKVAELKQIEEVIRPLGLIKRAKYLKQLAEVMCGVDFTPDLLKKIKGVGPYIRTLLLTKLGVSNEVALDRNGARLIYRFITGKDPTVEKIELDPSVLAFKHKCLDGDPEALKLTYALIDIGAQICITTPRCVLCSLQSYCSFWSSFSQKS
jgi:A/G-specific adenine glycosylase